MEHDWINYIVKYNGHVLPEWYLVHNRNVILVATFILVAKILEDKLPMQQYFWHFLVSDSQNWKFDIFRIPHDHQENFQTLHFVKTIIRFPLLVEKFVWLTEDIFGEYFYPFLYISVNGQILQDCFETFYRY